MSETHSHSPLAQFIVTPYFPLKLGGYDISFTNASLWMLLTVGGVLLLMSAGTRKPALIPGRWQCLSEVMIEWVRSIVIDTAGKEGLRYFPLIFTIFIFVLMANLLGMLPGAFTVTSHIIVTFALAGFIFVSITLLAIFKHGPLKFAKFFLPAGTPWWLAPLMYVIEIISYLARPLTLSIRLAANMMAGHTALKVIGGMVITYGMVIGIGPIVLLVLFTGFEIGIAVLQAYIFTLLACVYLNDALHLH